MQWTCIVSSGRTHGSCARQGAHCRQHAHDEAGEAGTGAQAAVKEDAAQEGAEEAVDDRLGKPFCLQSVSQEHSDSARLGHAMKELERSGQWWPCFGCAEAVRLHVDSAV